MAEALTLARPYAKAVFEVAVDGQALDAWSAMLAVAAQVVSHDEVCRLLGSPALSGSQQADLVIGVAGERLDARAANLVHALAENKRLALLPEIAQQFELLRAERQKTVDVEVIAAYAVPEALVSQLAEALRHRLDRAVNIQTRIDKTLIGGAVIRAGDMVIDGSLRGRLSKLAEALNA